MEQNKNIFARLWEMWRKSPTENEIVCDMNAMLWLMIYTILYAIIYIFFEDLLFMTFIIIVILCWVMAYIYYRKYKKLKMSDF